MERLFLERLGARGWRLGTALSLTLAGSASAQQQRPGQLPTLPLTQLYERAVAADLDNHALSLSFPQPVAVRDLLLLLVRGTTLSIVPDPAVSQSFIGELKGVTVRQALELILPPLGLDYAADGSFLRVFRREPETRLFDINYVVVTRTGTTGVGTPAGTPGSSARLETITTADLFSEIGKSVQTLLSERATFSVDRKAGLLQVTDFPERLDRVALYLDAVHDRVHRQVQIDARVLEVTVDDPEAPALDVAALIRGDQPTGSAARPMVSGLGPADVTRFLAALTARGKVSVLATPRVLVLNNEPALVRAASRPADGSASGGVGDHEEFTLGVTPQITTDGVIMLSLTPIVTVHTNADTTNPRPTLVRETDTIARIADGESIIVAGFTREQVTRERKNAGVKGGWFGRSTVVTRKRVELLVLLTPRIVAPVGTQ